MCALVTAVQTCALPIFKAAGYTDHALELLLVRLLFCLFADDTGIFPRRAFHELIAQRTGVDGADLGMWLAQVFQVLDTPLDRRPTGSGACRDIVCQFVWISVFAVALTKNHNNNQ